MLNKRYVTNDKLIVLYFYEQFQFRMILHSL